MHCDVDLSRNSLVSPLETWPERILSLRALLSYKSIRCAHGSCCSAHAKLRTF